MKVINHEIIIQHLVSVVKQVNINTIKTDILYHKDGINTSLSINKMVVDNF